MPVRISKNRVALENIPLNEAATVIVASATSTPIGAAASNNVDISGTTTITSFDTVAEGINRKGRFTGALTLTHNATSLILPGAANITTTANDRYEARSLGSGNWLVTKYQKADGTAVAVSAGQVIQVLSTVKTDVFTTTSTSFVDVTGLSRTITPGSTSNKVLVMVQITGASSASVNGMYISLLRDASNIFLANAAGSRAVVTANLYTSQDSNPEAVTLVFLDSPASVASLTYKIQIACSTAGTSYIGQSKTDADSSNHPRTTCSITCMEIKG